MLPKNSVYKQKLNSLILLAQQAGLLSKIQSEVKWSMQRSTTGKLLQASSSAPLRETMQEERQLTTADTEGMFLLMGIGYAIGAIALISEIVGGITNKCRQIIKRSRRSISSTWSSKRNSVVEDALNIPRTEEEEMAHAVRMARKVAAKRHGNQGFGWRQFNLTKTTLKELYGDYHKSQPDYVLKGGQVCVEEPKDMSDIPEETSRQHERNEKDRIEVVVDRFIKEELDNTLKCLDNTLEAYSGDDDGQQEQFEANEEDIFGSFVSTHLDQNAKMLENLQLFNEEEQKNNEDRVKNIQNNEENAKCNI